MSQITKITDHKGNVLERTIYTYDGRGNLVQEEYAKNNGNGSRTTVGEYTYDETNHMVCGVNANGESSAYLYNGLGALVENTWVIAKNGYGYHDVSAEEQSDEPEADIYTAAGLTVTEDGFTVVAYNKGNNGNGNGSGDKPTGSQVNNTSPVSLKVTSWTYYNEWGEIVHNTVLKCGQRELDLVKRFATHDYDAVLDLYYAKARFYDAANRRFAASYS